MAVIEKLAKARTVETMVCNIAGVDRLAGDLRDLAQMVYLILCEYDADKIVELWDHGEIRFFIARIIMNQLNSVTSPFFRKYRRFSRISEDIAPLADKLPDA